MTIKEQWDALDAHEAELKKTFEEPDPFIKTSPEEAINQIGSSVNDWAQGAKIDVADVYDAAVNGTTEDLKRAGWQAYKGTVAPALNAAFDTAALAAMAGAAGATGGVSALAGIYLRNQGKQLLVNLPMLIDGFLTEQETNGTMSAVTNVGGEAVKGMLPFYNNYNMLTTDDPEMKKKREERPAVFWLEFFKEGILSTGGALGTAKWGLKKYGKTHIEGQGKPNIANDFTLNENSLAKGVTTETYVGYLVKHKGKTLDDAIKMANEVADPEVKSKVAPERYNELSKTYAECMEIVSEAEKELKRKPTPQEEEAYKNKPIEERMDEAKVSAEQKGEVIRRVSQETTQEAFDKIKQRQNLLWEDNTDIAGNPIAVAKSERAEAVSIADIYDAANEITPVKVGKLKDADGAEGYFEYESEGIRIKNTQSFTTMLHEIGHYLDKTLGIEGADEELKINAKQKFRDAYMESEYRSEGVAEFFKEYSMNPEVAQANYPKYFELFEKGLVTHPELATKANNLIDMTRKWYNQTAEERAIGAIARDKQQTTKTAWEKIKTGIAEAIADKNAGAREAMANWSKKTGNEVDFKDNPINIVHNARSESAGVISQFFGLTELVQDTKILIDALSEKFGVSLHYVTFRDVAERLEHLTTVDTFKKYCKQKGFKSSYDALEALKVAQHNLEVIKKQNENNIAKLTENIETKYKEAGALMAENNTLKKERATLSPDKDAVRISEIDAKIQENELLIKDCHDKRHKMMNKRKMIEEGKADYKTSQSRKDCEEIIANAPKELLEVSNMLSQINENYLLLMSSLGMIDANTAKELTTAYKHYVPFQRDFSNGLGNTSLYAGNTGFVNLDNGLKKLSSTGSDRAIVDPLQNYMTKMAKGLDAGIRNQAGVALYKLSHKKGGAWLAMDASPGKRASDGYVNIWIDGKERTIQINDPYIYNALTEKNSSQAHGIIKTIDAIARIPAKILRIGATQTPAFTAYNAMRDVNTAIIQSVTGVKHTDITSAFKTLLGKCSEADKKLLAEFESEGVTFCSLWKGAEDLAGGIKDKTTFKEYKPLASKAAAVTINPVKKVWNVVNKYNDPVEMAPRFAEYKKARLQGKSRAEAAQMARDVTTDFTKGGTAIRALNRYAPFLNAIVQGNLNVPRNLKKHPGHVITYGVTYLTVPTVALWLVNKDNPAYQDIPLEQRMRHWFIPDGSGGFYKIPKPEMLGHLFASMPEEILNTIYKDDPYAVKDAARYVLGETTLGFSNSFGEGVARMIPTGLSLVMENVANYNFFRQRPIVDPFTAKNTAEEDQYNIYTSELAKDIGKLAGWSPLKVDNTLRGATGSVGATALGAYDFMFKQNKAPAKHKEAYTRFTYDIKTPNTRTAAVYNRALEEATKRKDKNDRAKKQYEIFKKSEKEITKARQQIKIIRDMQGLTGEQKTKKIDRWNAYIHEQQIQANKDALGYTVIKRNRKVTKPEEHYQNPKKYKHITNPETINKK